MRGIVIMRSIVCEGSYIIVHCFVEFKYLIRKPKCKKPVRVLWGWKFFSSLLQKFHRFSNGWCLTMQTKVTLPRNGKD